MAIILPASCSSCQHYDGDKFCSLPMRDVLIPGQIVDPSRVVCAKHEPTKGED